LKAPIRQVTGKNRVGQAFNFRWSVGWWYRMVRFISALAENTPKHFMQAGLHARIRVARAVF